MRRRSFRMRLQSPSRTLKPWSAAGIVRLLVAFLVHRIQACPLHRLFKIELCYASNDTPGRDMEQVPRAVPCRDMLCLKKEESVRVAAIPRQERSYSAASRRLHQKRSNEEQNPTPSRKKNRRRSSLARPAIPRPPQLRLTQILPKRASLHQRLSRLIQQIRQRRDQRGRQD